MRTKWIYDTVKIKLNELGIILISTKYKNNREKLLVICPSCKKETTKRFGDILNMHVNCKKCAKQESPTQENVELEFKQAGYILLDTYKNYNQKMKYKCPCGNIAYISYAKFKMGQNCYKCKSRKTKETFLLKYGVENCFSAPEIREKIKTTNLKRYGSTNPLNNPEILAKQKSTLLQKYGSESPTVVLNNYSKESQTLFWAVYYQLPESLRLKTYFAELNYEFQNNQPFFKYDFVISNIKKCIEYNGKSWHPVPDIPDDMVGWHAREKNKTAKEAREYENLKYLQLTNRGFSIFTIWDFEVKKKDHFQLAVDRCLQFLLETNSL